MSSLDCEVIKAIEEAVSGAGQPNTVAKRLVAWLNAMSASDLSADDEREFLTTVRDGIIVNVNGGSDED